MDDKVNYTAVGAFVLVLGTLLLAGVLWLSAGVGSRKAMDPYQGVIQESVAGLSVDAPVKYLGVDVGKVQRIEIDRNNSQQVRLHFLVAQGTPIKVDSEAVLKTQGLTGIAYVEISGGGVSSPPLQPGPDGQAPTIPFKPSLSARLENVLTSVLTNVDRVSNNLNAVFDAENRAALKSALTDIASVAQGVAGQRAALQSAIADASRTAKLTAQASQQFEPTLSRVSSSAQAVERMADEARAASAQAGKAAAAAASSVQQLGNETLPDLGRLMLELNQLSMSLRRLSDQTTSAPGSLLLGGPTRRPGPGEENPR